MSADNDIQHSKDWSQPENRQISTLASPRDFAAGEEKEICFDDRVFVSKTRFSLVISSAEFSQVYIEKVYRQNILS